MKLTWYTLKDTPSVNVIESASTQQFHNSIGRHDHFQGQVNFLQAQWYTLLHTYVSVGQKSDKALIARPKNVIKGTNIVCLRSIIREVIQFI